jgi:HEAT repeat protein
VASKSSKGASNLKRLDKSRDEDLLAQLAMAPLVGIGRAGPQLVRGYSAKLNTNVTLTGDVGLTDGSVIREAMPWTGTLPLRFGAKAQLSPKAAATLGALSQKLHAYLDSAAPAGLDGRRGSPWAIAEALRREKRGKKPEWLRPEAIPTMLQLLMHEDTQVRHMLVEILADISGPLATEALAKRAVYDLDPALRAEAVRALRDRPVADARPVFLAALRYPWAPAAEHAAEALAALGDKETVPTLVTMLKEPDPAAPRRLPRGSHIIREVVRAVHVANCLLCHPPASTGNEPVQGIDPINTVANRVPQAATAPALPGAAAGRSGGWGSGGGGTTTQMPLVIRADIIFLRQDFSVQLPVAQLPPPLGPGPAVRSDFFVRTRRLTKAEVARLIKPDQEVSYRQREAVLFALRELTGQDPGPSTDAWAHLYPTAQTDVEAAKLADKLVVADPVRLGQLLGQARDGDEEVCIKALSAALPRLKGEAQDKVHDALVQRLARLEADALRSRLNEENSVLRQAAIAACGRRREKEFVPDLIALLEMDDMRVVRQAEKGLEIITGQHFTQPTTWRTWWEREKVKEEAGQH